MKDVQIPELLNDPNIPDITQCERTENTFSDHDFRTEKQNVLAGRRAERLSPHHLADFSGLVAS